jgi:nitrite reductase (NADH) large subunit
MTVVVKRGSALMQVAIVGNGVAGITAATAVKERNPDAQVSIYTDENYSYYPRPRLYYVLSGEAEPSQILGFPSQWYEEKGIKVNLGKKALSVDPAKKELLLEDGSKLGYDRLLLANGARPFVPPVKGVEKTGVFTLRSVEDALRIREYAKETRNAIVIGGGLLGLELAMSLRKLGQQVNVVEVLPRLLPNQLDQDGATLLKEIIEARGIKVTLDVKTQEILGKETVSGVALSSGAQISGDFVMFSAGIRSNTELALKGGIKVNRGVVVDKYLQTNVDDVYAAGDAAESEGRVYGIIPAALDQAKIAALNMMETEKHVYQGTVPSNTLKIVGIDLASMGLVNPEGSGFEEIKEIQREAGVYRKIVLQQGIVVGAIILGETKSVAPLKRLIDQKTDVTKYKDSILEKDFDFRKIFSK